MDNLINPYNDKLRSEGLSLEDKQHVKVDIVRLLFDGKWRVFFLDRQEQVVSYVLNT